MSVDLVLRNRQRLRKIDLWYLRRLTLAAIGDEQPDTRECSPLEHEIGIHLVGTRKMAELNRRFLQHDGSTDVITLDYSERRPDIAVTGWMRGDIFICVDEALVQSRRFRTNWQSELIRYVIHGLLHLRGYDDTTPPARRVMKREENRLLNAISGRFPPQCLEHSKKKSNRR